MSRLLLSAFALFCLLGVAHAEEDAARARAELDAARQDIAELQKLLKQIEQEKSGVQRQLKASETEIGDLEKQIDALERQIKDGQSELQRLDEEKTTLQGARQQQQALVASQARATYQSGRQEYLKLLLNQQNPEKFSRTLTYYDYLAKARFEQIAAFNETLRQQAAVEAEILRQQGELQQRQADLAQRREQLVTVRQARREALAALERDRGAGAQRLEARRQDQAQLQRVLKTIEETLARQAREAELARRRALAGARERATAPAADGPQGAAAGGGRGGPFQQAKGKLPWPVDGRLVARYGSPRHGDARSTWDGVLIGASAGSTVRAIHAGQVVFADWLRGAGLLVIVDHGNGYLSLYGHNQSLLRNPGDRVKAGDPVATVGNSGGQDGAALYFAIRQNGRPADPAQWCRAQG